MDYPVSYRGNLARAATSNRSRVARDFVRGIVASPLPAQVPQVGAKVLPFTGRRLADYGTRKAIARLAARLLLGRILGPIGIAFDLYTLYKALQSAVPAHYDYTGWTRFQTCGGGDTFQYAFDAAGCGTKFILGSAEGNTLVTPNNPGPGQTRYSQQWLKSRTISGGVHFGPSGDIWRKIQPSGDPAPNPFIAAVPEVMPVILPEVSPWNPVNRPSGDLPAEVRRELNEWPEARHEAYGSDASPRPNPARWSVPYTAPSWKYEWEVPVAPLPGPRTAPSAGQLPRGRADAYTPAPPPRNTKEIKLRGRAGYGAILAVIGTVTESLDFVNALYKALPSQYRPKHRTTQTTRMKLVWEHLDKIALGRAFEELFWEQAEDMLYGKLGRAQARAVRRLAEQGYWSGPFGTTVGGANRQDVTSAPELQVATPTDALRQLLEPYYRSYVGER